MAFQVKKGSFASNTSTGNQAVSSVGFQPKAVIFFWTRQSAAGFANGQNFGVAWMDGSGNQWNSTVASDDNVSPTVTGRRQNSSFLISIMSGGDRTIDGQAAYVSMDSDGFTINWTNAPDAAYIINYLALGGSDLTNAKSSTFTGNGASGSQAVTGVGFQPDLVLFLGTQQSTTTSANVRFSMGYGKSSSQRGCSAITDANNVATTNTGQVQKDDCCMIITSAGAVTGEGDLVSLDSDGFTVDWQVGTNTNVWGYLALKGGRYGIGVGTNQTGSGTQTKSYDVDIKPTGLLMWGLGAERNTSFDVSNEKFTLGGTDGSSQGSIWVASEDVVAAGNSQSYLSTSELYPHNNLGSSQTSNGTINSFGGEGPNIDWNNGFGDSSAKEFNYIIFGDHTEYSRSVSDSASSSDSSDRSHISSRETSDTSSISDQNSRLNTYLRDTSDNVTNSDTNDRSQISARGLSDDVILSEDLSKLSNILRSTSDDISLSDLVDRSVLISSLLNDNLSLSDSADTQNIYLRELSEGITISDIISNNIIVIRNISESISMSDDIFRGIIMTRSTSNSIDLSDTLEESYSIGRSTSDNISISDDNAISMILNRNTSDSISLSENLSRSIILSLSLSDSITFSDNPSRLVIKSIDTSDSFSINDILSFDFIYIRNLSDGISLSDSIARSFVGARTVNDVINIADSLGIESSLEVLIGKITTDATLSSKSFPQVGGKFTTNVRLNSKSLPKIGKISSRPRL